MKDFYMSLLSNSSFKYYPQNTTSSFTVQLPQYMCLEGEWEVGVAEIQYPYTFFTVEGGQNRIIVEYIEITKEYFQKSVQLDKARKEKTVEEKLLLEKDIYEKEHKKSLELSIIEGFYKDVKDIVNGINSVISTKFDIKEFIYYNPRAHRVQAVNYEIIEGRFLLLSCKLSRTLAIQLGYIPTDTEVDVNLVEISVNDKPAPNVVNMTMCLPDRMIMYCDILEPQLFGDIYAKVLGVVITRPEGETPNFGQTYRSVFNPVQYIPVQKKHFEDVTIHIRDIEGKFIPFRYGTLNVKLHFKRIYNNNILK